MSVRPFETYCQATNAMQGWKRPADRLSSLPFKTTVNATLAIRKALRRYLGIEPAVPGSEMRETT
jgi:hypothetical protein